MLGSHDYPELLRMAAQGDNLAVDLRESEPQHGKGLGKEDTAILCSLGRMGPDLAYAPSDVARSLFVMVSSYLSELSLLHADCAGLGRVLLTGHFCRHNPHLAASFTQASQVQRPGTQGFGLRHDGYLGALGALYQLYQLAKQPG